MHFPIKHSGYASWNKASVSVVQVKSGLMPSYCPAKQIIFSDLPYVQMIFEEQMSLSFSHWLRGNVTIGSHCLQMRIFINGHRRDMKVCWQLSAWDKWKTPLTLKRMWKEHPLVFFLEAHEQHIMYHFDSSSHPKIGSKCFRRAPNGEISSTDVPCFLTGTVRLR